MTRRELAVPPPLPPLCWRQKAPRDFTTWPQNWLQGRKSTRAESPLKDVCFYLKYRSLALSLSLERTWRRRALTCGSWGRCCSVAPGLVCSGRPRHSRSRMAAARSDRASAVSSTLTSLWKRVEWLTAPHLSSHHSGPAVIQNRAILGVLEPNLDSKHDGPSIVSGLLGRDSTGRLVWETPCTRTLRRWYFN